MADLPPADSWVECATRPLEDDAELCLAARQRLTELSGESEPADLEAIGERFKLLDALPAKKLALRRWISRTLVAAGFVLLLACSIPLALNFIALRELEDASFGAYGLVGRTRAEREVFSALAPNNRFFVQGDPSASTPLLARKALWESELDNPVLYADYLVEAWAPSSFPSDAPDVARKIDPDNAYFPLLVASSLKSSAVERGGEWPDGSTKWIIKNRSDAEAALRLIREACELPRYESYHEELLGQRLALLPPARDFKSRVVRSAFVQGNSGRDFGTKIGLAELIAAWANELAAQGEADELRSLVRDWEQVTRWTLDDQTNVWNSHVAETYLAGLSHELLRACRKLDLREEIARLERIVAAAEQLDAEREVPRQHPRQQQNPQSYRIDPVRAHGSILLGLTHARNERFLLPATPPDMEALRPGRLMNYAVLERLFVWFAAIAAGLVLLLTVLYPFSRGLLARRLGARLSTSLDRSDWFCICALGIVAPILWYLAVTRLTPLGCRDWSLLWAGYQPFTEQLAAAGLGVIAAMTQAVRWRYAVRAKALGAGHRRHYRGWWGPLCLALAIPFLGGIRYDESLLFAGRIFIALGLLWFLVLTTRAMLSSGQRAVHRVAAARALASGSAALILALLLVLLPLTILSERSWCARDNLMCLDIDTLGHDKLSYERLVAFRQRLGEVLADDDP